MVVRCRGGAAAAYKCTPYVLGVASSVQRKCILADGWIPTAHMDDTTDGGDDHQCRNAAHNTENITIAAAAAPPRGKSETVPLWTRFDSTCTRTRTGGMSRHRGGVVVHTAAAATNNVMCEDWLAGWWLGCVLKSASDVSVLEVRCSVAS